MALRIFAEVGECREVIYWPTWSTEDEIEDLGRYLNLWMGVL